jgi:glycine betaine/proline transport system substrate-binding protein
MRRILYTTALTIAAGTGAASACTVSLGEMDWGSAKIGTAIQAFILEKGYGCTVEVISTTTIPAITSMTETGSPDAITEVWMNTGGTALEKPLADGTVVNAGPVLSDGGVEGWWIPKAFAEAHPEIRTVADVLANPQLFPDPESPGKGAFFNCPSGWTCQTINTNLLRAFGMTEAFTDVDPGSGESLAASIARASERGDGWFGYYWAPTSVLGKYPMVMIEMAPHDAASYDCLADPACASPTPNSYRAAEVNMIYTKAFAEREPEAAAFLDSVSFTNDVMNAVLAWQEDNGAEASQAAGYFAVTYPEVWKAWVTPEAAEKVTAALSQ